MPEELSHFLDTALAVVLGVFGWIGKKFADRLDKDEDRLSRIEVELSAQHERDILERRLLESIGAGSKSWSFDRWSSASGTGRDRGPCWP